jgi:hypothetical protein
MAFKSRFVAQALPKMPIWTAFDAPDTAFLRHAEQQTAAARPRQPSAELQTVPEPL